MMPRQLFTILAIIPLVVSSKQYIVSRSLKIFNDSVLVENIKCDERVDDYKCEYFTLFHIYAFAAKVPPSGAGIKRVQTAGYKIALLMETINCSNDIGNNDTVTNITIPAVLLSQTIGLSLLSYSSPTDDAEPTGSVIVEARYEKDYTVVEIIAISIAPLAALLIIFLPFYCCLYWKCKQRRRRQQYKTLPKAESKNLPKSEPPELTSSQAGHVNIPLQKINSNKQHGKKYGTVSGSTILTNDDAVGPQLKLQVNNNQDDKNKN